MMMTMGMVERPIRIRNSPRKWANAGVTHSVLCQVDRQCLTTVKEVLTPMRTILPLDRDLGTLAVTCPRALQVLLLVPNDPHSPLWARTNLALTVTAKVLMVIRQHIVLVVSNPYCLAMDRPLSRLRMPPLLPHHGILNDSPTRPTHPIEVLASLTMSLRIEARMTGLIRIYASGQDRIVWGLLTSGMTRIIVVPF